MALLVPGLFLSSEAAPAGTHESCSDYAAQAVRQLERGRQLGCPDLRFPVWSDDYDHHYRWCRTVPEADAAAGGRLRQEVLLACESRGQSQGTVTGVLPLADAAAASAATLGAELCRQYARNAVIQQSQNLALGCGLQGPEWNPDAAAHESWCLRGDNRHQAEEAQRSRSRRLAPCKAAALENGTHPGLVTGPRSSDPGVPQMALLDPNRFQGGPLLARTLEAATAEPATCDELSAAVISMTSGGVFSAQPDGGYAWQPASRSPRSSQAAAQSSSADLNVTVLEAAASHRQLRTARLDQEFLASPRMRHQLSAATSTLGAQLRPDRLAELERLKQATTAPGAPGDLALSFLQAITDLSGATASRVTKVCGLRRSDGGKSASDSTLWEEGVGLVVGRGFGSIPGTLDLEYEPCPGGNAQHCEDLRIAGRSPPPKLLQLELVSSSGWSDRLVAFRVPPLPVDLLPLSSRARIWVRPDRGPPVASAPISINRQLPHVLAIKTDSGFDPGGLVLSGWAHWADPRHVRHDIFWLWSQTISHGSGWIRTGCPTCPQGTRFDAAHLAAPGDRVYIYGQGFGDRPGDLFLTLSDPTASGGLTAVSRDVPIDLQAADWQDDRIRFRIQPGAIPASAPVHPYLVIVDQAGRWISGRWGLAFAPPMAIRVVSGRDWLQMARGEDDSVTEAPDGSSMIVSHPTGGCDSFLFIPLDTNERGTDRYFHQSGPQGGIRVVSAEFAQLDAAVSEQAFLATWGRTLGRKMAEYGPVVGFLEYMAGTALESGIRSLAGDNGAYYIYPQKNGYADSNDARAEVDWENTCTGPYANQTLKYSARFVLSGPRRLLYP